VPYSDELSEKYDRILDGSYTLKDWDKMELKGDLQEGKDYVLVSSDIWYSHFVHDL